ncbi:endonuclease [uncultured Shewanella sp.]|uniref:endonuclease n=1 Tax=uncultured Shewanella sp. TaxID=173975 RepID=UPI0026263199|nr:endonuclease [uncultured Shewanella sp.]
MFEIQLENEHPNVSTKVKKCQFVWDKQEPVSKWECTRAKWIQKRQGSTNQVIASRCKAKGL